MEPAFGVLALAMLFVGTHVGLATRSLRARLVGRLGERGFFAVYFAIAALTFWMLVAYYAAHRFEGAAGPGLGADPVVHALLVGVIGAGVVLAVAGLVAYPRLPVALFNASVREPYGVERITRHPFFAGIALIGGAHALLATHASGAVLMGALAVLSIVGARHQEAKYLRTRGRPYAEYLAVTSAVPFAAIASGRQRLVWRELPLGFVALALGLTVLLRLAHASLFAAGGRWIVLAVVGGGAVASLQSWLRSQRRAARPTLERVRG